MPQGAEVLVRRQPGSVVLGEASAQPCALSAAFKRQHPEPLRTWEVGIPSTGGPQTRRGWVQASRGRAAPDTRRTTLAPAGLSAQTLMRLSRWRGQRA